MLLSGKNVLITGAAGGIGKAVCALFREHDGKVAAADLTTDGMDADAFLLGDLTDKAYCDGLPAAAAQALGGIDILINNAGVIPRGTISDTSDEDFAQAIAINVEAPFRICRAAIPLMIEAGGGVIVNTASCWGVHPGPNHAVYCMTKAALASLTQCMGRDHAHQNIRVNAVCPNEVDTPMLRSGFERRGLDPDTGLEQLASTVPMGRVATPSDIANVILFLASDRSSYMTGALVEVNGGKPVG